MYINHEKYALVNGVVLDGTRDMVPRTGLAVCVDGDRIAAVCGAADVPEGYARVDLGVSWEKTDRVEALKAALGK